MSPSTGSRPPANSRAVAADLVSRWLATQDFPDFLMESVVRDRAFVMELVYGVTRRRRSLEWALAPFVARTPEPAVHAGLLVGAYQLLWLDNVATHAAVNETVEAVKTAGGPRAAGFANRVLRRIAEQAATLRETVMQQPLGIRESFPDVLVRRWEEQFGPERAAALCHWQNTRPQTVLRVDRRRTSVPDLLAALKQAGHEAAAHPFRPERCVTLPPGVSVPELPGFADGHWMVQDPATLFAVEMLGEPKGLRVLDACAAPGGKALCLAEAMDGGDLTALELHADRMAGLRENVERMRAKVRTVQANASDPDLGKRLGTPFDAILADVPCTNTGVIRRRPDARWRFTTDRMRSLTRLQNAILDNLAHLVKPGGVLVYSTCSLEPEENAQLVDAWLARHPEFTGEERGLLFSPDTQTDGAFAARLRRHAR